MPGLAGRISTLTKAKVSHMLDHAEDPAETLDYAYERQIEDLQNVKKGIADVVTAKKRLQMQEQQLHQQADKLDGQAREAMSAGREDLARTAIERKQMIVDETSSLDQQIAEIEAEANGSFRPRSSSFVPRRRSSRRSIRRPRPRCTSLRLRPALGMRWRTSARRCSARSTRPTRCRPELRRSRSCRQLGPSTT
jgi:hypothetical protein